MTKRLQILMRLTRRRDLTVVEWVREAIRMAKGRPSKDSARKLTAIREAAKLGFPTSDMRMMLAEIEHGYGVHEKR